MTPRPRLGSGQALGPVPPTPTPGSGHGLRAVLFDAGNTLVFLDYARLADGVGRALGLPLTAAGLVSRATEAAKAMETTVGTDQERAAVYLESLFRLGGVPDERLVDLRECLVQMHGERHLWCSVHEGTHDALDRLRTAGLRLGVVSNSDGRVGEALVAAGLSDCFDVVIDSGLIGIEKPDPRIFQAALDALGVEAGEALYVGDLYEIDVVGARAAGIEAVLLTSSGLSSSQSCRTAPSIHDLVNALLRERP